MTLQSNYSRLLPLSAVASHRHSLVLEIINIGIVVNKSFNPDNLGNRKFENFNTSLSERFVIYSFVTSFLARSCRDWRRWTERGVGPNPNSINVTMKFSTGYLPTGL